MKLGLKCDNVTKTSWQFRQCR